jgi:hypothetical protein
MTSHRRFTLLEGDRVSTVPASTIDTLAAAGDRPLAVDHEEGAAYLGVSAAARAAQLASLHAPDFSLPDLAGRRHSLSEHRGKKVLLVAFASW